MQHGVRGAIGVIGSVVLFGSLESILRVKRRQLENGGSSSGKGGWRGGLWSSRVPSSITTL